MWPLLFTYKSPIFGRGFIADVEICGRVLAEMEAEGIWLYGVQPGAFAVEAPTLAQAGPAMTARLSEIFIDVAEEVATFADFKAEVERFFQETDDDILQEWTRAVEAVKSGQLPHPAGLPVRSAEAAVFTIRVTSRQLAQVTPDDNAITIAEHAKQQDSLLAAAA